MPSLSPLALRSVALFFAAAVCSSSLLIAQEATPAPPEDPAKPRLKAAEAAFEEAYKKDGRKALGGLMADLEKIIAEFPKSPEAIGALAMIAFESSDAEARPLWVRLANSPVAKEKTRQTAKDQLAKLDMVGKPVELKFKALDGREVDLAALKGKVVLIDFWATWCGPCMKELPHLRDVVNRYKDQGVEIIGVSLDNEKTKDKLPQVIEREKMFWPQYFDGLGWKTEVARRFHINSIPAVWLIDQQGIVRDTVANLDLEPKIKALLKK